MTETARERNAPNPYEILPSLPPLEVSSSSFTDGSTLAPAQRSGRMGVQGGQDVSPQVSWTPGPEGTESYVVTVFDPDAPTASGFWHWCVANIPAEVTSLPEGACRADRAGDLPDGAVVLRNDAGYRGFVGAAPPEGDGDHRYLLAVHAVAGTIVVEDDSSCAFVGFTLFSEARARGYITGLFGH